MTPIQRFPYAHTFSIVARDPQTGELGAAVQSHWFSVGSLVAWVEPGAGAVATQAMVEVSHGPLGLALMRAGKSAADTLAGLLASDAGRDLRQIGLVDAAGTAEAHTGARCMAAAGHVTGEGFSAQANMMEKPSVWGAMAEAYRGASGDLSRRLLAALEAAQAEGGDIRGQQSACIKVCRAEPAGRPWEAVQVDLRVEDHPRPIEELRRLMTVQAAYALMNRGDEHLGRGETEQALECYRRAAASAPGYVEMPFWHAVTLADLGRAAEALPLLREVIAVDGRWRELLRRLPPVGMLSAEACAALEAGLG